MIRSFRDADAEALFREGRRMRRFQAFERVAIRKLQMLDAATTLAALAAVPGNRLEPPKGNRQGQHSIRINDQWRVCFVWRHGDAHAVEITDYHT